MSAPTPVPSGPAPAQPPPFLAPLALVALGLFAMGGIVWNSFVQDDMGVIATNGTLHAWSGLWRSFVVPYWPPVDSGELYRPLSSALYTLQWMVGGGDPRVFRMVSLGLYAGSILGVWRLLRALTPTGPAWIGAALFAIHPVHVEAVAAAVNQSELLVAILLTVALLLRIGAHRGVVPTGSAAVGIALLFPAALLVKESALILPGLLLAVDLLVDREEEGFAPRWLRWRWHYATLVAIAALFWWLRSRVLGPGTGTDAAEALDGAGLLTRAYTMLGAPAEWLGLLLWPAHLQTDWNLLEWVPTQAWSLRETAGALGGLGVLGALALAWQRRPVTALGLGIVIIAIAPVSNVLIPSGIILAERTLFVASIGVVLVLADLASAVMQAPASARLRPMAVPLVALILGLGAFRSAIRVSEWRDRETFLRTLAHDAPNSWHARLALGVMIADQGDTATGRLEIRRAIELRPDAPLVVKRAADNIRLLEGKCRGPILIYEETLARMPRRSDARGSLVACLLWDGLYAHARQAALAGIETGLDSAYFRYAVGVADSAVTAAAPRWTVRLLPIGRQATVIGPVPPSAR